MTRCVWRQFGGFSADALADRILDAKCEVIVTSDGFWRGNKLVHLKEIADHGTSGTGPLGRWGF